jgi:hypothetical protein
MVVPKTTDQRLMERATELEDRCIRARIEALTKPTCSGCGFPWNGWAPKVSDLEHARGAYDAAFRNRLAMICLSCARECRSCKDCKGSGLIEGVGNREIPCTCLLGPRGWGEGVSWDLEGNPRPRKTR